MFWAYGGRRPQYVFPVGNARVITTTTILNNIGFRCGISGDTRPWFGIPLPPSETHQEAQWRAVMAEELEAAERQGALSQSSSKDGIVLVVSRQGKVLRRGVGIPAWKAIREDVEPQVKKKDD